MTYKDILKQIEPIRKYPTLYTLCELVVYNDNFRIFPASQPDKPHSHHAYDGGLVAHTWEVIEHLKHTPNVDMDVLLTAAVWHDYGKIYDYYYTQNSDGKKIWRKSPHHDLVRHVARSYQMWVSTAEGKISTDYLDTIGHCILAHHGRFEWGSPVEPKTPEALALHNADMMSSKYGELR